MKGKLFCEHLTIENLDPILIALINSVENKLRVYLHNDLLELTASSGARCKACNALVGGKAEHEPDETGKGHAVDLLTFSDQFLEFYLLKALFDTGIYRIGLKNNVFVHAGNSTKLPNPCIWTY